jgi:hypothetical protein
MFQDFRPLYAGLQDKFDELPGAHAPGFMPTPASQAQNSLAQLVFVQSPMRSFFIAFFEMISRRPSFKV